MAPFPRPAPHANWQLSATGRGDLNPFRCSPPQPGSGVLWVQGCCGERDPRSLSPWPPSQAVAHCRARAAARRETPDTLPHSWTGLPASLEVGSRGCRGKGSGLCPQASWAVWYATGLGLLQGERTQTPSPALSPARLQYTTGPRCLLGERSWLMPLSPPPPPPSCLWLRQNLFALTKA